MRKRILSITVGIFVIILFGGVVIYAYKFGNEKKRSDPAQSSGSNFSEERAYWSKQIDTVGAEKAYAEFKQAYAGLVYGAQHSLAHIFGVLLFEKEGVHGVGVCDSSFGFGCYHSFFGAAVGANGLQDLPAFDEVCKKTWGTNYLPCQHGIGHGVMYYFSDSSDSLQRSLDACASISWHELGGCASGVFMEYNFHTMADLSGSSTRVLGKDVYEPCTSIAEKFRPVCYFEQTQWWETVFKGDYTKMGTLCNDIAIEKNRTTCFQGIGNYAAPFTGYDIAKTRALCDLMPLEEGNVLCREGAGWIFRGRGDGRDISQICEGLSSGHKSTCVRNIEL